ncbi:MAG: hypothetical protein HY315_02020 [Acidobacteria bacterium]|nr:hypothetical protein [Acidobacteriota bacterium]
MTLRLGWIGLVSNDLLVQTGTVVVQANVSDPTIEVYYPVPYETPPELTWPNMPYQFGVREQRTDGFKVQFTSGYSGTGLPTWQAKGMRRHR